MRRLRAGDTVMVTAGKFKGTKSTVMVISDEHDKITLKGVNIVKRAKKGQGFIEKEAPLHISNVMLFDETSQKPSRVGITVDSKGKKTRLLKKSKTVVGK